MLRVLIKPEVENFIEPNKAHESDSCFDVYCHKIDVKEDGLIICYLGFSTEIPEGWKGVLIPRSSITKTGWIMPNSPGQIDSGFRNQWQMRFRPLITGMDEETIDFPEIPFKVGDRVGQMYFEKVLDVALISVEKTSETERGKGGFGSTGK